MLLSKEEAYNLILRTFSKIKLEKNIIVSISNALVNAELDNIPSHGFSRIPYYYEHIICGKIKNPTKISIRKKNNAIIVNADYGFAFPAIEKGLEKICKILSKNTIALLFIEHSHHCGVLGHYVEQMARKGFVGLAFSNTPSAMASYGGHIPIFGTNPIAFGCPYNEDPIIIDMALSKVARGKILSAKQMKQSIPNDWACDKEGNPTTDPNEALLGTLTPIAGAKGTALALMVEIMCSCFTNSYFSYQASSFFDTKGSFPNIGQAFIFINPYSFNSNFQIKVNELCSTILNDPYTHIPGMNKFQNRRKNLQNGITIPDLLYKKIIELK